MKLFEYQAKQVFSDAKIPVPRGITAEPGEISKAVGDIGLPCVLKAQVLQGGRGKAGLISVVRTEEEAVSEASRICSVPGVNLLLVEEFLSIQEELFVSVTCSPVTAQLIILASRYGGIDIETLAEESPEKLIREPVDIFRGLQGFQARHIAYAMGLEGQAAKQTAGIIQRLFSLYREFDAELAEINPLCITETGEVTAGDAKLVIDDSCLDRHPQFTMNSEHFDDPTEYEAALEGIPYLKFDGDISLMCAGAGLTTAVFDLVHYQGGTVANYLEFGGPNYRKAMKAMELCLRNPSKVILVVTFGTIARADVMAQGIVDAVRELKPDRPVITCIRGTHEEEAVEILSQAGLEPLFDTEEAVRRAVAAAAGEVHV